MRANICLLFVVVILAGITSLEAGSCITNLFRQSREIDSKTSYCPQYASDSCCDVSWEDTYCTNSDGCRRTPDACSDVTSLIECAYNCRPNLMDLFKNGRFQVCSAFYDRVVDKCLNIQSCSNGTDCRQSGNQGSCVQKWSNGDDIFRNYFPLGIDRVTAETEPCFNTGSTSIFSMALTIIAIILSMM